MVSIYHCLVGHGTFNGTAAPAELVCVCGFVHLTQDGDGQMMRPLGDISETHVTRMQITSWRIFKRGGSCRIEQHGR